LSGFGIEPEKYISPEIQNELVEAIALGMMRQISSNIQNATFFAIMADKTADVFNKEKLVICIRWVEICFETPEDFIGIIRWKEQMQIK